MKTFFIFLACIGMSLLTGALGSIVTIDQIPAWYAQLVKPAWNPPSWVFGPVWNVLYVLMGTAAAIVWKWGKGPGRVFALWFFFAHLIVNFLWSYVFFGLQEIGGALVVMSILWISIVAMIVWFSRYSKAAAWLLVPYLLWVSFAFTLNAGILVLN